MFSYGQGQLATNALSKREVIDHSTKQLMSTLHTDYLVLKPQIGNNWIKQRNEHLEHCLANCFSMLFLYLPVTQCACFEIPRSNK